MALVVHVTWFHFSHIVSYESMLSMLHNAQTQTVTRKRKHFDEHDGATLTKMWFQSRIMRQKLIIPNGVWRRKDGAKTAQSSNGFVSIRN